MEDLYNLIAEIIRHLLDHTDADFYKRYHSRTQQERRKEIAALYQSIPMLFEEDGEQYRELGCGNDEVVRELACRGMDYLKACKENGEYKCLLRLLEFLDMALERQMVRELESRENTATGECLNPNYHTLALGIVPRCPCYWERGHRGSQHHDGITNHLKNILFIDKTALGKLEVVHHYLPVNTFLAAEKRGKLSVAVSPLGKEKNFRTKIYEKEDSRYFSLQYAGDAAQETQKIKELILEAAKEQADILIFPEACGNTRMTDEISDFFREPFWLDGDRPPAVTVLPSVWDEDAGRNVAHVMDAFGNLVCSQNKQEAYLSETEPGSYAYEDIRRDGIVHLVHGTGIGRMVVMICKDFITNDYLDKLLRELKVTLILVPSFSTGYHDFEMMSGKLLSADCCAVWVNAAAAEQKAKEQRLGFIVRSGKNRVEEKVEFYIEEDDPKGNRIGASLKVWNMYYKTKLGR